MHWPLVKQFFDIIGYRDNVLRPLSAKSGIGRVTLWAWTRRAEPRLGTFMQALEAEGFELVLRRKDAMQWSRNHAEENQQHENHNP